MLKLAVFFGKVLFLLFVMMWIRWTLPRFRFDQLMRLSWEGMIPAALLLLLVTSFMVYMGWVHDWMWLASLATIAVIWIVYPMLPRQASANRRIPLIGSRFSPLNDRDASTAPSDPRALAEITSGER